MAHSTYLTYAEAQVPSEPVITGLLVRGIMTEAQDILLEPQVFYRGDGLKYWKEKTLGERLTAEGGTQSGAQADAELRIDIDDEIAQNKVDLATDSVRAAEYALMVRLPARLQEELTDQIDQLGEQLLAAVRRIDRAIGRDRFNLTNTPGDLTDYSGWNELIFNFTRLAADREDITAAGKQYFAATADATGVPFRFEDLDLLDAIVDGGAQFFVAHKLDQIQLKKLITSNSGGLQPVDLTVPGTDLKINTIHYGGVPVLCDNYISRSMLDAYGSDVDVTDDESAIYAVRYDGDGPKCAHYLMNGSPQTVEIMEVGHSHTKDQWLYLIRKNAVPFVPNVRKVGMMTFSVA